MADTNNNLPSGAGATTGSTTTGATTSAPGGVDRTSGSTASSTRTQSGFSGGSDFEASQRHDSSQPYGGGYERTGREVVLAERQRSAPSAAVVVGAAVAGAIAGGAIPFMLSGLKSSNRRVSRSERSDLHYDHGDVGIDARSNNRSGTNR